MPETLQATQTDATREPLALALTLALALSPALALTPAAPSDMLAGLDGRKHI